MVIDTRMSLLALLLLLGGCQSRESVPAPADATVTAKYDRELIPENVVVRVQNAGSQPLCISIAETQLGGKITLEPKDALGNEENRPPPVMLSGFDIGEGLFVLPPHKGQVIWVRIPDIEHRIPKPTRAFGSIRYALCTAIFDGTAKIGAKTFSVEL